MSEEIVVVEAFIVAVLLAGSVVAALRILSRNLSGQEANCSCGAACPLRNAVHASPGQESPKALPGAPALVRNTTRDAACRSHYE